jgi:hypothetical protein
MAAGVLKTGLGSRDTDLSTPTLEICQQNQGPKNVLLENLDFPINAIGGYRFPQAKKLDASLVESVLWHEVGTPPKD